MLFNVIIIILLMITPAYSESVVDIARSQIGHGEIGGDNRGKYVKEYTRGREVAWCAGFVSWVLNKAKRTKNYHLRARSFWEDYRFNRVRTPKPGDVVVFKRGNKSGHVGIVESYSKGILRTIEGNSGEFPAKVKRKTYKTSEIKNLLGYVRI